MGGGDDDVDDDGDAEDGDDDDYGDDVVDTHGHDAGDKVLVACAERIKSSLRRSDIVCYLFLCIN